MMNNNIEDYLKTMTKWQMTPGTLMGSTSFMICLFMPNARLSALFFMASLFSLFLSALYNIATLYLPLAFRRFVIKQMNTLLRRCSSSQDSQASVGMREDLIKELPKPTSSLKVTSQSFSQLFATSKRTRKTRRPRRSRSGFGLS